MNNDRFDVNCMLGRWADGGPTYLDAVDLLAAMDRLGIARALVRHTLGAGYDPAEGNARLTVETAANARLVPCLAAAPDALRPESAAAAVAGARAVCLYPAAHTYPPEPWILGPHLGPLAERRVPVLIELSQCPWDSLERLCAAHPTLRVVLLAPGYRALRPLSALLDRHPHLYVELSNLVVFGGIEALAARFGVERLLFGTGQPRTDGAGIIAALSYSALDGAAVDAISAGNLDRLLAEVEV